MMAAFRNENAQVIACAFFFCEPCLFYKAWQAACNRSRMRQTGTAVAPM